LLVILRFKLLVTDQLCSAREGGGLHVVELISVEARRLDRVLLLG